MLPDTEVACVVDGGFGAQRASFLVVLLDARVLVVDVQRGDHAVGDHSRTKLARSATGDPAIENQLHLIGPSDIQVLANHFFEEDASADRAVQDLGQRELRLQDGELVPVTGLPVWPGEGMGQFAEPFP